MRRLTQVLQSPPQTLLQRPLFQSSWLCVIFTASGGVEEIEDGAEVCWRDDGSWASYIVNTIRQQGRRGCVRRTIIL